jgi:hypothetical protein
MLMVLNKAATVVEEWRSRSPATLICIRFASPDRRPCARDFEQFRFWFGVEKWDQSKLQRLAVRIVDILSLGLRPERFLA